LGIQPLLGPSPDRTVGIRRDGEVFQVVDGSGGGH
jgi:hypothetical protein